MAAFTCSLWKFNKSRWRRRFFFLKKKCNLQPRLNSTLPNYNRITECLAVDYEYRTVSDRRTDDDVYIVEAYGRREMLHNPLLHSIWCCQFVNERHVVIFSNTGKHWKHLMLTTQGNGHIIAANPPKIFLLSRIVLIPRYIQSPCWLFCNLNIWS